MCNQEVKFKLFLEAALEDGADMIATGHYACVDNGTLKQAVDSNKDQTYFLYRVTATALEKTLFPLGEYTKPQVREMAAERGLSTAGKKDSQGICFVGKVGIREFLSQYVQQTPGKIIDKQSGTILGHHDGAIFYTLGQRHGLDVGGGLPYYVVGKNMDKNEVYVTTDLNDANLWKTEVVLHSVHWIGDVPQNGTYDIRIRHRAPLIRADLTFTDSGVAMKLHDQQRAVAAGQSIVIYDGQSCIGGGIVT
jgi:tRNA-specific 2-thiouridylase